VSVTLRQRGRPDAEPCGRICYAAFTRINTEHGFPPDFPGVEVAIGLLSMTFNHPGFYAVVAERDGRIVGRQCDGRALGDRRHAVRSPSTHQNAEPVAPDASSCSTCSTELPRAAFRACGSCRRRFTTVRCRSTRSSGSMRASRSRHAGPAPLRAAPRPARVRPAREGDALPSATASVSACTATRETGEVSDANPARERPSSSSTAAASRGYATGLAFFAHAVGETDDDVTAECAAWGHRRPGSLVGRGRRTPTSCDEVDGR